MKWPKLETMVIATKGACAFAGPALLSYNASISQWSNETALPSAVQWSLIISGSVGVGILSFSSYLSSSFGKYVANRTNNEITLANGDTQQIKKADTINLPNA